MKQTLTALTAVLVAVGLTSAAESRPDMTPRQAGTLTCTLDPGFGLVLGSVRGVSCAYDHVVRGGRIAREVYAGTMNRSGLDLGVTGPQALSWAVVTPGGRTHRGILAGAFGGSSGDASVVFGAGTQSLFAQSGVMLQPISRSGQVGLGVGFGITALQLYRAPAASYASFAY